VGLISDDPVLNPMATFDPASVHGEGTTLFFDSWIYAADGSSSFTRHLAAPVASVAESTTFDDDASNATKIDES